ncbi:MAG: cupin domain-containing protein [Microbacterium sp.]|uniref:cupin domain-containing protein n=1 Tax=Microbacterium sp. TaxID=51671 RepID=UPI0039E3EC37
MTSLGGGFVKWIEDGAEIREVHNHDEVIIVLEGETTITTPDGRVTIGKGGSIIVKNGTPAVHTAVAGTKTFYTILLHGDERV